MREGEGKAVCSAWLHSLTQAVLPGRPLAGGMRSRDEGDASVPSPHPPHSRPYGTSPILPRFSRLLAVSWVVVVCTYTEHRLSFLVFPILFSSLDAYWAFSLSGLGGWRS